MSHPSILPLATELPPEARAPELRGDRHRVDRRHAPSGESAPVPLLLRAQIAAQMSAGDGPNGTVEAPPRKRRGRWLLLAAVLLAGAGFAGQHAWRSRTVPAPA